MTLRIRSAIALAAIAAFAVPAPHAFAQSNADLLKELKALKDRVDDLEKKLAEKNATTAKPAEAQWGMTPEQLQEFNRISVKTEALEDGRDAAGFKGLKISGYADPTYIYNKDQRRAGFQFLNPVASDGYNYDNSYFGAAALDILKETDSGVKWHLTLIPNRGTGSVFGDASVVQEASVSVPLGDLQTRLLAGQLPDWSGYEYLPPTQNRLITHNLLFDFTLPTAYTGAGVELIRGKWDVKTMLGNVNASKNPSGRRSPVLVYRADYSKGEFQGFGFAGLEGRMPNFATGLQDTMTSLIEVDGYFIRGDLTVQGQLSYGVQKDASITPDPVTGAFRDAKWWGLSALAAYKFQPRLEGIARMDYINNRSNGGGLFGYNVADDRNGIGPNPNGDPNVGANRFALSLGVGYALDSSTTLKAEYRLDWASQPVFINVDDGSYTKTNHLLGASVVVAF